MTDDKELIARLNNLYSMLEEEGKYTKANTASFAKERIEALTKERDEAMHLLKTLSNMNGDLSRDLYKTKLLLAKAVEALENLADCVDMGCFCSEMKMATAMDIALATIAEIKGESHD